MAPGVRADGPLAAGDRPRPPRKPSSIVQRNGERGTRVPNALEPVRIFLGLNLFFFSRGAFFSASDVELEALALARRLRALFFSWPLLRPLARRTLMFVDPQAAHVFSPTASNTR
jgi:hypothetical protein